MYKNISNIYDTIHQNKSYDKECDNILRLIGDVSRNKLLDVGCGTGTHLSLLSKHFIDVIGIDISEDMIIKAKEKSPKLKFIHTDINNLKFNNFNVIVSMFNVVNHIHDLVGLITFLKEIFLRLDNDGVFVFDMFNGIAPLIDPPKNKIINYDNFTINMTTDVNHVNMTMVMNNNIDFFNGDNLVETLKHRLWTLDVVMELLYYVGFSDVRVVNNDMNIVSELDYKIILICKKHDTTNVGDLVG